MSKRKKPSNTHYLLAFTGFGSFRNNIRYLRSNWRHIERPYYSRVLITSIFHFLTALVGFPLRRLEDLVYAKKLRALEFHEPPIFVVGHWRSGTTYLHNLLCQDKNFAYITLFQTLANDLSIVGKNIFKPALSKVLPKVRPTDNVHLTLDQPQEEEHAVARNSPYSFYHLSCFPKLARVYFEKYVLFNKASAVEVNAWKQSYLTILKKVALSMGNRQLILKNPVNTGRIKQLLEIFPDAKFVYIFRNPYDVFLSTRNQYRKTLEITRLQSITEDAIDADIIVFYKKIMQRYLEDKALIPKNNLVEIRFEDLEKTPLSTMKRIYDDLRLSGFTKAETNIKKFIARHANYKKNHYRLTDDVVRAVSENWKFAFDTWGYDIKHQRSSENLAPIQEGINFSSPYKRKPVNMPRRAPQCR